ncbi:BnaA04g16650D [Brassica napus]|uniref:BnaA04g16650D protein n=1 Tax=Brassica napus TaxID=3708 RepID=A0A078H2T5_BRANA|nr:BnaA04g16650D [Brassica napus]
MTILSVLLTTLLLSLPLPSTQDLNADRAALLSLHSPVCSELDLTIPVPSLEFPARPRRRLGCGW